MARTRKNMNEFASVQCTAEGGKELLDLAEDIVAPAILGASRREQGQSAWFFMNQAMVQLSPLQYGIAFEFVRDIKLHRDQIVKEGKLIAAPGTMASAPSAVGLLVLNSHRLIYLPKTRHAPTLRQLEQTFDTLFKQRRKKLVFE